MTRELLLPCPFCGGEASFGTVKYSDVTVNEQGWQQDTFHSVNCVVCGTSNRGIVGYVTQDKAREKWNRRAQAEASAARLPQDGGTVPREPTQEMIDAVYGKFNILGALPQLWRAMWDAAPRASEGKEPTMEHWQACDIALGGDGGLPAAAPADPHASTAERYADRFAPMRAAAPDAALIAELTRYATVLRVNGATISADLMDQAAIALQRCRERLAQQSMAPTDANGARNQDRMPDSHSVGATLSAPTDQNPASGNSIRALSSEHTAGAPAAPDAELIVEINHYFEDGGEADPCAHPCENLLQRCRDRLEQGANATSIAWKFGYAQAQEEKQPPITDAEVAACLEPLPDWNTEVGTLLERAVQMRGTVSALWDSLGIAKKQIQMYHAEIARKDKALREIASIRPFGMISDAQIIASAALGDTQEPQS